MNCILLPTQNFASDKATASITAPAQIEHINRILAAKVGDTLKIGEINGGMGTAVIAQKTAVCIQLTQVDLPIEPPDKLAVTVILALPRPKVLRRLIMDMTALGVRDIVLINSYRTQKSYWQSPMLARLDEFVLEGLQQGVDTIAPRITLQKRFKPFVEDELAMLMDTGDAIVAHPYAACTFTHYLQKKSAEAITKNCLPSVVFIGAEGGWIDYEMALLAAQGCQAVNIGARVLRTEAAVNVILGQWLIHRYCR